MTDAAVNAEVAQLSEQQKLAMLGGTGMFTVGYPSLGIPILKMSDGPAGVRSWGPSDAYPAGIALAATWDPALAEREGASLALDAKARGVNVLPGPGVNIYRLALNGRNFEYFGEDPLLAAKLATGYIEGVQDEGIAATVKHFVANNSEFDRHNTNSIIDERTLHEIYLPAFEAAVRDAHVAAVMDSYNLVNGEHMTQNRALNVGVLRDQWGFQGVLMSDWNATYDGLAAANSGLDLEMPKAKFMTPVALSGKLEPALLDEKVRRIVALALAYGSLTTTAAATPESSTPREPNTERGRRVAYDVAAESLVLLKNAGRLLPLDATKLHSVAVIGPNVKPPVTGGGGSSNTQSASVSDLTQSLASALGPTVSITYSPGVLTASDMFARTRFDAPLKQEQFASTDFTGTPQVTAAPTIAAWHENVRFGPGGAQPHRSFRWTGSYTAPRNGEYIIAVGAHSEDSNSLLLDGKEVFSHPGVEGTGPRFSHIFLRSGQKVRVEFRYVQKSHELYAGLGIVPADEMVLPEAKALARSADMVIADVGFNASFESESYDRTWDLPAGQDQLVHSLVQANPHVIVVLNGGGGMNVAGFVDEVPALLHAWYGGEQGANALADALVGKINPSGKLPVSFERRIEDNPSFRHYYPAAGTNDVPYAEGVFVGYRGYDRDGVAPLFPFGFGLSYTQFRVDALRVEAAGRDAARIIVTLTNTGRLTGADTVQVYVGEDHPSVPRPVRELKAFQRVELAPGEHREISFALDQRAFSFWDVATHTWKHNAGPFTVWAGDSSRDLPVHAPVLLAR